jgi:hypothetical protein
VRDDSLNITTKTMLTLILYLDNKTILESDYCIGGVQTTVVENDVDRVISHAALLKELAEKNRPKKK